MQLQADGIYRAFALDCPEYVLVRLMGRVSISIGRRLGEIYDKVPRLVAAARFNLSQTQVAPKLGGLELDIGLVSTDLAIEDFAHVQAVTKAHVSWDHQYAGVGIEIRYNFNPNDSARLRKDVQMAGYVANAGLLPIYVVFSTLSPRDEAIARLKRAGWNFLIGEDAETYLSDLFGLDVRNVLEDVEVRAEIKKNMGAIMQTMVQSYAFQQVLTK